MSIVANFDLVKGKLARVKGRKIEAPEFKTPVVRRPTGRSLDSFFGWRRENGRVGVRNHVLLLPLDDLSNAACEVVANNVKGTLAIPHAYGRLQFGEDLELHFRTLIGTGSNPNVAAVVVIGNNKRISKKHCSIWQLDGVALLQDTSSNGTFVNGIKLKGQTRPLQPGDTISFPEIIPDSRDNPKMPRYTLQSAGPVATSAAADVAPR